MNISSKFLTIAFGVLAAGGFAWMIKIAVIAASDGAASGLPEQATAILWTAGVALMALGVAGVLAALSARVHILLGVVGAVGGLLAWGVIYVLIESAVQSLVGEGTGPVWLHDEVGILSTGTVLMAAGLLGVRRTSGLRFSDRRAVTASASPRR